MIPFYRKEEDMGRDKEEIFRNRVSEEYEEYKKETLSKSPGEIYGMSLKTAFYRSVGTFFTEEDISGRGFRGLLHIKRPLSFLWEEYLKTEGFHADTPDDIRELAEYALERLSGAKREDTSS